MQFGTCIIYNANFITIKQDNFKTSLQNKYLCFVCTMLTIYLKSVFHLIKTFYLLPMFVLFLIQTTNLSYLIIGMKLSALKKYSFLLFLIYLGYAEGVPSETWVYEFLSDPYLTDEEFQAGYSLIVVVSNLNPSISCQIHCQASFVIGLGKTNLGLSFMTAHRLSWMPCPVRRRGMPPFFTRCHSWCREPFLNSYLVISFQLLGNVRCIFGGLVG